MENTNQGLYVYSLWLLLGETLIISQASLEVYYKNLTIIMQYQVAYKRLYATWQYIMEIFSAVKIENFIRNILIFLIFLFRTLIVGTR